MTPNMERGEGDDDKTPFETLPVVNKRDVTRDFTGGNETWQDGQAPVYQELDNWEDPRNLGCSKFLQVCGFIYIQHDIMSNALSRLKIQL